MADRLDTRGPPSGAVPRVLARVTRSRVVRDDAARSFERTIVEAIGAGHSLRVVARAAGLTHGRVAQIVKAWRESAGG